MTGLKVFIGWDSREDIAYQVARVSLLDHASIDVDVHPIRLQELIDRGAYTRGIDPLSATEFTYSRFLTPWLAEYKGWALFVDCDFMFFADVRELLELCDESKAVLCVHHAYAPKNEIKMDGKVQTVYPRKNWSSCMLFNCDHPSSMKLTPEVVSRESGAYLHQMRWAADDEIGEIPVVWNWLEGWNERPASGYPKAVHYTNGGPWFKEWQNVAYAHEWLKRAKSIDPCFEPI